MDIKELILKNILKTEISRGLSSRGFLVATVSILLIICLGGIQNIMTIVRVTGTLPTGYFIDSVISGIRSETFIFLFPICITFAYSYSCLD